MRLSTPQAVAWLCSTECGGDSTCVFGMLIWKIVSDLSDHSSVLMYDSSIVSLIAEWLEKEVESDCEVILKLLWQESIKMEPMPFYPTTNGVGTPQHNITIASQGLTDTLTPNCIL